MLKQRTALLFLILGLSILLNSGIAEDKSLSRLSMSMQFHLRSQERTGVLVPMYVYPANIHTNSIYNRLIELKRQFETVPMWIIINPASGPGKQVDANYTKAIDRLCGAGCVVLGYVTTSYGKRPSTEVNQEIDRWRQMYPRIHGVFFDEMIYEDTAQAVEYQSKLTQYAHSVGCWPTVANPGTDTPGRYFQQQAADVIVVHEGNGWPQEERLKGDYFGGYSDYPPHTRAVLVHSQPQFSLPGLRMTRKYARWVYVTEDLFRPDDPSAANPWDSLSRHLDSLCQELSR